MLDLEGTSRDVELYSLTVDLSHILAVDGHPQRVFIEETTGPPPKVADVLHG